jgi:hypothetical protein
MWAARPQNLAISAICLSAILTPAACFGWGNEGHEIVAAAAARVLADDDPAVLDRANALLATDTDNEWTDTDMASEATWADALRANSTQGRTVTADWHFVDIDFDHPNADQACFGHPVIPPGKTASEGPTPACVIDKIGQFSRALGDPSTTAKERLLALKFLLHFVGDIHQPLHAITHIDPDTRTEDRGGNCVGILRGNARNPVRLHSYWDTTLVVRALRKNLDAAVDELMTHISSHEKQEWARGTATEWAQESYDLGKSTVYEGVIDRMPVQTNFIFRDSHGQPDNRCGPSKVFKIDTVTYDKRAVAAVKEQLAKAAVRLAWILKENLH